MWLKLKLDMADKMLLLDWTNTGLIKHKNANITLNCHMPGNGLPHVKLKVVCRDGFWIRASTTRLNPKWSHSKAIVNGNWSYFDRIFDGTINGFIMVSDRQTVLLLLILERLWDYEEHYKKH